MFCLKDLPLRPSATPYLVVVLLLITTVAFGQVYPVQVTAQLTAPYSPYLSDYTTPGSQKLRLQLRLNDPTLSEYRCKLRITIEGVGITLKTKQNFIPQQPIIISGGGIPEQLYGDDLTEYFHPNNLDFAGLSRGDYTKSAKLPEGVYRFSFEVLDYNRNTLVSNKGMATAWIILNDPPILNLPRNDTKIKLIDPTNIVFTWTSRHKSSPNAVLTTEYKFRLIEIWPLNRNPYDAVLTQPPLYEVTTDMEQLIYGPAEPMLIPGRKYAWQVQAVDQENRDLFKNQGRSEVFVFQYGDALLSPENLRLQTANQSNLTVRWDQTSGGALATTYRIQYREHRNRSSNEWYQLETTDQWKAISMLKADTEYEVQVRAEQFFQQSAYSEPKIFRTLPIGANEFVCRDDAPPPPLPSTATPLFNLMINDTIKAGGYDILVRKVQGGTGTYSGEGMAIIPYLNGAKVRVTFENIRVNEQNMLTAGVIKSYWNAESKFMLDTEKETPPSQIPNNGNIPVVIAATEILIEIKDAAIATITKDENGNAIVHTTDGQEKKLEKGESYSVVDELGNGYVVDKDGNVTKTTATEAKAAHDRGNRNYNLVLRFEKGDGAYGFDDLPIREPGRYNALASHYQQVDGQYIAWKALTSSQPDAVMVIPENASMNLSDVRFEVNTSVLQPQNNGGAIKLSVQGKAAGMVEELIASTGSSDEQAEVIGKLNLVSYDQLNKKVVIVPVNNTTLPSSLTDTKLSTELTKIFSQAVVSVQVKIDPKITVTLGEDFDDGESGMLSNYTGDMKKVINAYGRLENETYYLFLVENPRSGNTALGYMPRSKQAGFIFVDNHGNNPERLVRTMAHELSHGMFNLKHTFSEYSSLSRGATQNLMDYSPAGTELLKYQWDYVHDPQRVIPLFEGDEEGEMSLDAIKDEISVQFISVTQDFTPGVNKLVIEYKFAKLDSILKVHSDKTFNSSIQIYDKDNEYVYAKDLPLEQSGKVEWDGFLNEERSERIWFKNGPYVIQIKILGGLESTWDRFLACLGSPIDCIYGELQTTISGYAESTFNINEDRENWEQLTFKKVDPGASFTDYLSQKNMFISDLGLQENENPLEYLNNNLIEFEFLGEVMVMHKRFAYVLKTIKESFNEAEYANLSNSLQISNGFRAHKTTNSGVSRHQLGMAIDINPGSNPMLLSDSQAEIFQYIRIVTGLDMHNKSVTLEQTIAAQDLFKTRVLDNQLTLQKVKDALDAIHNYNKDNNKLNFIKLSQNVIESTIANSSTALKAALTSSTSEKEVVKSLATECLTDISNLKEQVTDALTILNHYKTGLAIDQTHGQEFRDMVAYLNEKLNKVQKLIIQLEANPINNAALLEEINTAAIPSVVESFSAVNARVESIKTWVGQLNTFGQALSRKVSAAADHLGGNLFKNGFFNLPTNFSKAMEDDNFIRWGGGPGYRSLKDWMHFEIDPAKMRELLALDEDTINAKVND